MPHLHYEDFLTEDESLVLFQIGSKQAADGKLTLETQYFALLMKIAEGAFEAGKSAALSPNSEQVKESK